MGCESIVHTVNSILDDNSIPSNSKCFLQIDLCNAFNSIDRSAMFEEIRHFLPSMSSWMELCYQSQPNLLVDKYCIKSCCWVQQGDPLGTLEFVLALHPIIKQISEEVPSLELNVWYLDNGILCGSRSELLKALNILELEGPRRGLYLNRDKCLLFVPPGDYNSNDGFGNIPIVQDGFVLLGSPVGSPSFIASHASAKVEEVKKLISFLPDLKDSHMQFCLLRYPSQVDLSFTYLPS